MTYADAALDRAAPPHAFYNHEDEAVYKLCASRGLLSTRVLNADDLRYGVDDPQLFHGLPVGLQLVGRTLEEEGVIAMTEVVDRALKAMK